MEMSMLLTSSSETPSDGNESALATRDDHYGALEKRVGKRRPFDIIWIWGGITYSLIVFSSSYPGVTHIDDNTRGPQAPDLAFR